VIGFGDRCGVLAPGRPADLLLLDADLAVRGVYVGGVRAV